MKMTAVEIEIDSKRIQKILDRAHARRYTIGMLKDSILKNAPAVGSTDGTPENEKPVVFTATHANGWKWTAYEAERVELDDILCFGRVDGFESELGYFTVDELLENEVEFLVSA
jgi:hypothetical protein